MKVTYYVEGEIGLQVCYCTKITSAGTGKMRLTFNCGQSEKIINFDDVVMIKPIVEL